MEIREIEVAVISDLHLATHACKPKKILKYLKSIRTSVLVLNGDIIDSWRFSRNYFPKSHLKVIRQIIKMMEKGTRVIYVTGNHDEFLRKFSGAKMGLLEIANQFIFEHNGKRTWIFHGDIFDKVIHKSKRLAKFGAALYGLLTIFNKLINWLLIPFGKREMIIYKIIKKNFVREKRMPSKFEKQLAESASAQGYHTVICGHTHIPKTKMLNSDEMSIQYINCGDWVEHLTAAEYYNSEWHLYTYNGTEEETPVDEADIPAEQSIYQTLVKELTFSNLIQVRQ
nr:UDP-2,3-diacylglucosamine diphosphatase [uncultured Draconibacterium sp.]